MRIDPTDPRPPYRQISDELRRRIVSGELAPGAKLPSERELRDAYGVTAVTASQAIDVLKAEGLVDVRSGRGTFVREKRPHIHVSANYLTPRPGGDRSQWSTEATRHGQQGTQDITHVGTVPAPSEIAARMDVPEGESVLVRRRVMHLDGEPVQLADSYYPLSLVEGTDVAQPRKLRGGTIGALERLGVDLGHHKDEVSARMPTPDEVRALRLGTGVPVLRLTRTTYAKNGRPVEVSDAVLTGDRHILAYELPA